MKIDSLHGTVALTCHSLRSALIWTLGLALISTLVTVRILKRGMFPGDPGLAQIHDWILVTLNLAALVIPFLAAGYGFGGRLFSIDPAGALAQIPRRQQVLSLPVGGMAYPAAMLARTVLLALVTAAAILVANWILMGSGLFIEMLATSDGEAVAKVSSLQPLHILAWAYCAACLMPSAGAIPLLWVAVLLDLDGISELGYSAEEIDRFLLPCWIVVSGMHVALPFILLRRGAHHLATEYVYRHADRGPVMIAALAMAPLLVIFERLGMGTTFYVTAAIALAAVVLIALLRPRVPRRARSNGAVALALMASVYAALATVGAYLDHRTLAAIIPGDSVVVGNMMPSPDGRLLAVQVTIQAAKVRESSWYPAGMSCVMVVNLEGETLAQRICTRFTDIAGWSADGSKLLIEQGAIGRMRVDNLHSSSLSINPEEPGILRDKMNQSLAPGYLIFDVASGALTDVQNVVPAPGWQDPADLLRFETTWGGVPCIIDRLDRRFPVELRTSGRLWVSAYDEQGAILTLAKQSMGQLKWIPPLNFPIANNEQILRWRDGVLQPFETEAWTVNGRPQGRRANDDLEMQRGDVHFIVEDAGPLYYISNEDLLYTISDASKLSVVDLATGDTKTLLEKCKLGLGLAWSTRVEVILAQQQDQMFFIHLATAKVTKVPDSLVPERLRAAAIATGQVLTDGRIVLIDQDGDVVLLVDGEPPRVLLDCAPR